MQLLYGHPWLLLWSLLCFLVWWLLCRGPHGNDFVHHLAGAAAAHICGYLCLSAATQCLEETPLFRILDDEFRWDAPHVSADLQKILVAEVAICTAAGNVAKHCYANLLRGNARELCMLQILPCAYSNCLHGPCLKSHAVVVDDLHDLRFVEPNPRCR